jgi:hypothetical protein
MDQIASALQRELRQTVHRLKDLGGAVVLEDYPGAPTRTTSQTLAVTRWAPPWSAS